MSVCSSGQVVAARVEHVLQATPTIKTFALKVPSELDYHAGQWVDLFMPGLDTVGGFSLTSAPSSGRGRLQLAIKYSKHPPSSWMHTKCAEGTQLSLRVGGDVFYDAEADASVPYLFVAGGIGVGPVHGMLQERALQGGSGESHLLYSAATASELLFRTAFDDLASRGVLQRHAYFLTRDEQACREDQRLHGRRLSANDLQASLDAFANPQHVKAFICGPPAMIERVHTELNQLGMQDDRILYEKWW